MWMMYALGGLFLSLRIHLSLSPRPKYWIMAGFLGSGSEQAEKRVTMATAPVLFSRPSVA